MTVETLSPRKTVDTMTVDEVRSTTEQIWSLPVEQASVRYGEIAKLFQDAHDEKLETLTAKREKQEVVINAMLDNPAESFRGEFEQLMLLYSDRSVYAELRNGARIVTFCTQNHDTHEPAYTFKLRVDKIGVPTYSVTKLVEGEDGVRRPLRYGLHEGRLTVGLAQADVRGQLYTEYFEGDDADEKLAPLFHDTIKASGLQLERPADEREEYDTWAKERSLKEYEGIKLVDAFQTDKIVL